MKSKLFIISVFLLLFFHFTKGQSLHLFKLNRHQHGLRHGLWITYSDSLNNIIESRGRYRKGNEKGKWRYYYTNGKVRKKEVYKCGKIKTTLYYENGKIEKEGYAKVVENEEKWHYYFYGPWKCYSKEGKLVKIVHYDIGGSVREENFE